MFNKTKLALREQDKDGFRKVVSHLLINVQQEKLFDKQLTFSF